MTEVDPDRYEGHENDDGGVLDALAELDALRGRARAVVGSVC